MNYCLTRVRKTGKDSVKMVPSLEPIVRYVHMYSTCVRYTISVLALFRLLETRVIAGCQGQHNVFPLLDHVSNQKVRVGSFLSDWCFFRAVR